MRKWEIPQHQADVENGKLMFIAGGCMSCHRPAPDSGLDPTLPSGGKAIATPIGALYPPNLTPDRDTGLGNWTDLQFANAMKRGLGGHKQYLIPAFPYASYSRMRIEDILDIKAYLDTLPAVSNAPKPVGLPVEFLLRRGIGLWQYFGLRGKEWQTDPAQSQSWNRGSYLVNGPGHCQECHTPRNLFMAMNPARAFMGGPHPEGKGTVPSLRGLVERGRYKDVADLVSAFQNGETLGYEHMSSGGMGEVQTNLSKLPESDLRAMAEYILSLK